jgi:hypothetical protein
MRSFVISLDEAPEERWREVISAFKPQITRLLAASDELKAFLALGPRAQFACRQLLRTLPAEQQREVRGASKLLGIGEHCGAATQLLYEAAVFAETFEALGGHGHGDDGDDDGGSGRGGGPRARLGCTAVAIDCAECPVHGRTLDWIMPGVDMRKFAALLIDLKFTRGGRVLYSCTSIAGDLGVLTGVRAGAFSVSINFRKPFAGTWTEVPAASASNHSEGVSALEPPSGRLMSLLQLGGVASTCMRGGWPVSFLTRHLLESVDVASYDEALNALAGITPAAAANVAGWVRGGARVIAPCYVMLVGAKVGEGSLITCEGGLRKHVRLLSDEGVLATANCDSYTGCAELPLSSELEAAFTPCTAKDEQLGESLLRRDLALRAVRLLSAAAGSLPPSEADARAALHGLLRTSPIGNEATVHETILCAGRTPHLASCLSSWPRRIQKVNGLFDVCCSEGCESPTWYVDDMRRANTSKHRDDARRGKRRRGGAEPQIVVPPSCYNGSLPKRRGSVYYCEEHCLEEAECSVRSTDDT